MTQTLLISLTFIVYLIAVFVIGLYAYRRTKNAADYFLGGRNLPPVVAALSAGASDMSGWLLIGLPGFAYAAGLESVWLALGLCVGMGLAWWLVAKRLRIYSELLNNALTLPTYFQRRFGEKGVLLRSVSAVFILLFFLFYVCSGLIGGGKLFNTVFGVPYQLAVVIGALAVISYTLFGGFLAVSWTDVLQGLLMALALVIVPLVVLSDLGGSAVLVEKLSDRNPNLLNMWTDIDGKSLTAIAIISSLGWGLGYFGQPHILARFKAVHTPEQVPVAALTAVAWSVIVFIGAISVGLAGAVYLPETLDDAEQVFMVLVELLFHPLIAGALLAAILAAIMSTADSQLLVSSSALAEDIWKAFSKREITQEDTVKIGRYAVIVLALMAMAIAMDQNSKVLDVVAYAWAGLGAAFGPAVLISLFWPRMTRLGAFAGIVTGGLTVVIWKQLSGGLFDVYELVPGFSFSFLAILLVSLFDKTPDDSVQTHFRAMQDRLAYRKVS